MTDYSALRAAAEVATPGAWYWDRRPGSFDLAVLRSDRGGRICDFGYADNNDPAEGTEPKAPDMAFMVAANPAAILAMLDELDALRAASKPAKPKRDDYPADFDEVWAMYPAERQGTKKTAFKAWNVHVKRGVEPAEIANGLRKYLAHAEAIGTETKYLKLAATFFGPDEHFTANYVMPSARVPQLGKAGQSTANAVRELMGRR